VLYRNTRTGEVYESPTGRDGRLEAVATDLWLPVDIAAAATPFQVWTPPPSVDVALADLPADEMETL
jgi:hypothetical protein